MTRTADQVDRLFAALADPTRREIVRRLAAGDATIRELADPFAMSQQAVSQHVKVLEEAGLVSRGRVAQTRPCRLEPEALGTAIAWIVEQRDVWDARHDRLAAHLDTLSAERRSGRSGRPR